MKSIKFFSLQKSKLQAISALKRYLDHKVDEFNSILSFRANPKRIRSIEGKLQGFCAQDQEIKHWAQRVRLLIILPGYVSKGTLLGYLFVCVCVFLTLVLI